MKLFIANCSRQAHVFNYKIPEKKQSFGVTIRAGKQHVIDYPPEVIQYIIEQHEPYGFQPRDGVDEHFSGICYSIEKTVSTNEIIENAEQKVENLDNLSQSILEANAVSMSNAVDSAVLQSGQMPKPGEVQIEITGEAVNTDQDNAPSLSKTVKVRK
jgi:hypothetical protein